MATTCPACGAHSATSDYCDSCGAVLTAAPAPAAPARDAPNVDDAAKPVGRCPHCDAVRTAGDEFCEVCGLDFKSGKLPAAPTPAAATTGGPHAAWIATVDVDPAFYATNQAEGSVPVSLPADATPRDIELTGDEVIIGRRSESSGFFPGIDLSSPVLDPAVSHRHAFLRRLPDGSWSIVDESSTNGTWLNDAPAALAKGAAAVLHDGDHVNLGSFTRITFRTVSL